MKRCTYMLFYIFNEKYVFSWRIRFLNEKTYFVTKHAFFVSELPRAKNKWKTRSSILAQLFERQFLKKITVYWYTSIPPVFFNFSFFWNSVKIFTFCQCAFGLMFYEVKRVHFRPKRSKTPENGFGSSFRSKMTQVSPAYDLRGHTGAF